MALLDSEFSFTGPLGNLSAYRMRGTDKIVIRRKGGASKKQIKTSPTFVNTRRVNAEFGGRAFASKWIMHMLYHVKPLADYNIAGPLNAILKPTQDLDTTNKYGERSVLHSQKRHLLHGFSLTRKTTFESVLRAPLTYELSREMMSAEIHLPELIHGINFHTPRSTDGEFSETYPNGQLKIKGLYKNGKADSTWTFYFSDGKIFKTGNYKDCSYDLGYIKILGRAIDYEWHERGIENGTWKIYHKNGVLKTEYKSV